MRSFALFAGILFTLSAQARWFNIGANCFVNSATARCSVYNNNYYPMFCQVAVAARTYRGFIGNSYQNVWVQPGTFAYVYANANNPYVDPLVAATANARCRF
jgi:hypothetical protein